MHFVERAEVRRVRRDPVSIARAHERFRSREEWDGAVKLVEYWLDRLSAADRDYVFMLLAPLSPDADDGFDFREML